MSAARAEGFHKPLQKTKARRGTGRKVALSLTAICLANLVAGCGSAVGDANAGPNPGGGFYGAPNLNVGRVNP